MPVDLRGSQSVALFKDIDLLWISEMPPITIHYFLLCSSVIEWQTL